jgi:hypothetical protein
MAAPQPPRVEGTLEVEPAHGFLVRDPVLGDVLPPGGRVVERSLYWIRRLRDGDVIEVKRSPAPAPAAPEKVEAAAPAVPTAAQVVERRMENEL